MILPFDTETTGFPSSKKNLTDKTQPHLVSLSALQVEPTNGYIQQSMSKLVCPVGWDWVMDHPAAQVHGLTPEQCTTYGNSEKSVLDEFLHLWFGDEPSTLIAHNLKFDRDIIAIAIARYYPGEATLLQTWLDTPGICTQRTNKEAVGATTVKGAKKMPNLAECHKHFLGEELESHHSANADAVAVYRIYMAMQQQEQSK